ncbi:MAG: U32 family peptidase [Planctomycetes bacterium]|nr:U32 family peptidase [Planctomycetota bacterium]
MKISLATNFDPELIRRVQDSPVDELFGKLSSDVAGGGRASYQIEGITRRRVADHVRAARAAGIRFNYLLNGACLDNHEFTRAGQKELRALLDWLTKIGVEAVTVGSPFLLKIVKQCYPHFRTRVSVFACIDHVRKAKMWEELGADCLMLDSLLVNREFKLLKAIRAAVKCDLELLVNNSCMSSCAYSHYHMNTLAHASQSRHHSRGFFIDWCFLRCTMMKLTDPINYIRSEWIRPEDLHLYESMGYDRIKITERGAPTDVLARRVKAYTERRYDGNLLDLVQPYGFSGAVSDAREQRRTFWWRFKHLFRPFLVDLRRLWNVKRLAEERGMLKPLSGPPPVVVDNRALDGFMDRFQAKGCKDVDCESCQYCHRWAERAVRIEPQYRDRCVGLYDQVFDDMHSGRMWGIA